jgi:hypothetical protein
MKIIQIEKASTKSCLRWENPDKRLPNKFRKFQYFFGPIRKLFFRSRYKGNLYLIAASVNFYKKPSISLYLFNI